MGIKEVYKRIKDRELQFKQALNAEQEDYNLSDCSFLKGELAAMKFVLKIIEEECPESLVTKANEKATGFESNSNAIMEIEDGTEV